MGVIAALAVALVAMLGGTGVATGQPTGAGVEFGRGYVKLVQENLREWCPGPDDSSNADDDDEADSGLDKACGIDDEALWEAVAECAETKSRDEDEIDGTAKKDFLECMAKAGYGEEPEKEEAPTAEDAANLSLSRMASALSGLYVNSITPGEDGTSSDDAEAGDVAETTLSAWGPLLSKGAEAGAFIAAPDRNLGGSTGWIFGAGDANNDASLRISSFDRSETSGVNKQGYEERGAADRGVEEYLLYGATLSGLGFDHAAAQDDTSVVGRGLLGGGLMLAYLGAGSVDAAFSAVISVLEMTNPFSLLADALSPHTNSEFTDGMKGDSSAEQSNGAFDDLKSFLAMIIDMTMSWSWYVTLPVLIAFTLIAAAFSQRGGNGSRFKSLIIKLAFVVVGLPLLGTTYTGVLVALSDTGADAGVAASANADKVILSTLVDFEAWSDRRLASPVGDAEGDLRLAWDREENAPAAESVAAGRATALAINAMSRDAWSGYATTEQKAAQWNASMMEAESADSGDSFMETLGLIRRYMAGDQVSAGGYETDVKAALTKAADESGEGATVRAWVEDFTNPGALAAMTGDDVGEMQNPLLQVSGDGLSGHSDGDQRYLRFQTGTAASCTASDVVADDWKGDGSPLRDCNMSPLSMYNYLNTSFTSDTAKLYNPSASSSSWAREQHMAVNLHGGGAMSFVYWFSAMTLLVSFTLIGLFYCLGLLVGVLKNMVSVLSSTPFALLGFQAGIAKIVVTVVVALVEIVGTLLLYRLMTMLMMAMPALLEAPLAERATGMDADQVAGMTGFAVAASKAILGSPATAMLLIALLSCAGVIIFTVAAIKARGALIGGLQEAASRVINKFMETEVSAPGSPNGPPGAMKQGAAKAVGLVGTGMAMNAARAWTGSGDDVADAAGDVAGGDADGGSGNPGAPGAGDGSMLVTEAGGLTDAAGNPVVGSGGSQLTAMDMMPVDAAGHVVGDDGSAIIGESGSPLAAGDVAGFDGEGRLLDADGEVMRDANGNEMMSGPASAAAGKLAGDKAVAAKALSKGLSGPGEGTRAVGGASSTMAATAASSEAGAGGGSRRAAAAMGQRVPRMLPPIAAATAASMASQAIAGGGRGGAATRAARESMSGKSGGGRGGPSRAPAPAPSPARQMGGQVASAAAMGAVVKRPPATPQE